ncbi:MAG TPA: hypothetical protein VMT46_03890 [Anaerolineaceae bacterium]|nr:hypothetical protein [Anaerolineaceae bacterium]
MDSQDRDQALHPPARNYRLIGGTALIMIGVAVLLDGYLKTGWLALVILPATGFFFLLSGIRSRTIALIIPGGIVSGLGIGAFFILSALVKPSWQNRIGLSLMAFALGWVAITLAAAYSANKVILWPLVPGGIIGSIGACFLFSPLRLVDFCLYVGTCLGLVFLLWGLHDHLFGLIIPGSLLVGLGPGVYLAWGKSTLEPNSLARVGILLVSFAFSWGLITVFSRVITEKFIWWPLIPGGVLAMVGWGLYIGGNPGNAVSFIGNTGSIGLIIFGLYLLLWRKGIQK